MRCSLATFALAAVSSAVTLVSGAALESRTVTQGKALEASVTNAAPGLSFDSLSKGPSATKSAAAANLPYAIYGCDDYYLGGTCWYIGVGSFDDCYNLPPVVDNRFSSIAAGYTDVGCFLFTESNCGGALSYVGPDVYNGVIGVLEPPFYKSISSVICQPWP